VIVSAVESEAALSEAALIGIGAGGGVVLAALGVWFWRSRFPSVQVVDESNSTKWTGATPTSNFSGGWASAVAESAVSPKSASVWVSNPVSGPDAQEITKMLLRDSEPKVSLADSLFPKSFPALESSIVSSTGIGAQTTIDSAVLNAAAESAPVSSVDPAAANDAAPTQAEPSQPKLSDQFKPTELQSQPQPVLSVQIPADEAVRSLMSSASQVLLPVDSSLQISSPFAPTEPISNSSSDFVSIGM
jgi:hypothetical protein